MHPNTFLRTFWRTTFRPEIFVAMSFSEALEARFRTVIEPAIAAINYHGQPLKANRVDLSRSGDSILTDIMDGVAHSVMVLADVSTVGSDSKTGVAYRNGNVMYEVGLALACRQSSEVLLVRDDKSPFLFDVSTVPHMHIEFSDSTNAMKLLSQELVARLKEIDHIRDARLSIAAASLTAQERGVLAVFSQYGMNQLFWLKGGDNLGTLSALPRLLDKQLLRTARVTQGGTAIFRWTELGKALASSLHVHLPEHPDVTATEASEAELDA